MNYKSDLKHSDADSLSGKPFTKLIIASNDEIPFLAAITNYEKVQQKDKQLKFIIRTLKRGNAYQNYQLKKYCTKKTMILLNSNGFWWYQNNFKVIF